jgi:hypothetical protein
MEVKQMCISKGKHDFYIGETVLIKPHSHPNFIGQILGIDGNIVAIGVNNVFYFNYSVKQLNKIKNLSK